MLHVSNLFNQRVVLTYLDTSFCRKNLRIEVFRFAFEIYWLHLPWKWLPVWIIYYNMHQDSKGQIKSEWIYEIINFPKTKPIYLKDFCPLYYNKNSQVRNPSNFSVHFLEIDDFINSFWFNLTFRSLLFTRCWW